MINHCVLCYVVSSLTVVLGSRIASNDENCVIEYYTDCLSHT